MPGNGSRPTDLRLATASAGYNGRRYAVTDLRARAKDGTMVPLSHVAPTGTGAHADYSVRKQAPGLRAAL